jgi:alpha-D-xyloside xylohydrolase
VAVIVTDFFHWDHLGDWNFDPDEWPEPGAMIGELESMGSKLMVSVWPTVSPLSVNYALMEDRGLLISNEYGPSIQATWPDRSVNAWVGVSVYDATNPEARQYIWQQVEKNYYELGVRVFWLDACEPEIKPSYPAGLKFAAGPGSAVCQPLPPRASARFLRGHGRPRGNGDPHAMPFRVGRQPTLWRGRLVGRHSVHI